LGNGGAIYVSGDNNVITDSKFYGNEAFNDGGAIFLVGAECCVNNSYFESNSADEDGGAIYSRGTSVFNIDNSIFVDNSAGVYGGALFSENYAIVNSSTFNNNSALAAGAIFSDERINISDSVFNENSAEVGGAIILNDDAGIANSNITNNDAVKGGAIAVLSDLTLEINGTQFKGNLAEFGSNNIVLMTNATVMADNKTTSDSPLVVEDTDKPILKDATITAKTASFVINYAKSYSITLKDSTGKAISGKKITFKLNGKTIGSAYTNSKGVATLKITSKMLKAAKAGNRKLTVTLNDNVVFKSVSKTVTVKINKEKTKLVAKKKTFKAKTKVKKFTVTLKNSKGKAIKNTKLTLKVKGKVYTAKTNKKGKATFKIKKLTKKGKYTAVIKFKTTKYYKATSKKVKITVKG
jgi:predicted outer membrane repeat protein